MSEIKLCKDCKWCAPFVRLDGSLSYEVAECMSPNGRRPSPLDGSMVPVHLPFCKGHRAKEWDDSIAACCASGKWFELKETHTETPKPAKPWWRFW